MFQGFRWNLDEPRTLVEVGSYEGESAMWLARMVMKSPLSRLYCIDPWADAEATYSRFDANIGELPNRDQITVMRSTSVEGLMRLNTDGVKADFVYIDGSHAAPDVLADLVLSFPLVKLGGYVVCDDYLWDDPKYGGDDIVGRPKIAIDAFTTIYARKIFIARGLPKQQAAFRKVAE